jgi:lipoate-protein ligase A
MRQWRLIYDAPAHGAFNMAVDEAILTAVTAVTAMPTLRLYAWSPPCLSLGYGQKSADIDLARVARHGWDTVRRPTGGRAILHDAELTYSVSLPPDHPLAAQGILESYRHINSALVAGLILLDLSPRSERLPSRRPSPDPVCLNTLSDYEITVAGRKLIGSAQLRRRGAVLQHGSLPLSGDLGHICDGLFYPDEASRQQAKSQVRQRAVTLADALGKEVTWRDVADAVVQGFESLLGTTFFRDGVSESEHEHARLLAAQVYRTIDKHPVSKKPRLL